MMWIPIHPKPLVSSETSNRLKSWVSLHLSRSVLTTCHLHFFQNDQKNPPAPKVLGRDRPDGTRKRLQVYLGGAFFGQNLLFLIGRDARLQKTL